MRQKKPEASRTFRNRSQNLFASQRSKAKQYHCLHVIPRQLTKEWLSKKARDLSRYLEPRSGRTSRQLALILRHNITEFLH